MSTILVGNQNETTQPREHFQSSGICVEKPVLRLPYVMDTVVNTNNNIKEKKYSTDPIVFPYSESSESVRKTVNVIEQRIQSLSDTCGVDLFSCGVIVAGGYILKTLMEIKKGQGQKWGSDIDLFFGNIRKRREVIVGLNDSDHAHFLNDSPHSIRYLLDHDNIEYDFVRAPVKNPSKLVERFDLSVCAIAIEFSEGGEINIHMTRNFMDSVDCRRIRINNIQIGIPVYRTFDRISKYIRRGFTLPENDFKVMSRLVTAVPEKNNKDVLPLSHETILGDDYEDEVQHRVKYHRIHF